MFLFPLVVFSCSCELPNTVLKVVSVTRVTVSHGLAIMFWWALFGSPDHCPLFTGMIYSLVVKYPASQLLIFMGHECIDASETTSTE